MAVVAVVRKSTRPAHFYIVTTFGNIFDCLLECVYKKRVT